MIGARKPEVAATLAETIGRGATHGDVILLAVNRSGVTDALTAAGDLQRISSGRS
jgi:hypothetical protein